MFKELILKSFAKVMVGEAGWYRKSKLRHGIWH